MFETHSAVSLTKIVSSRQRKKQAMLYNACAFLDVFTSLKRLLGAKKKEEKENPEFSMLIFVKCLE